MVLTSYSAAAVERGGGCHASSINLLKVGTGAVGGACSLDLVPPLVDSIAPEVASTVL